VTSDLNVLRLGSDDNFAYIVGEGTVTVSSNLFIEGSNDPIKTAAMTVKVTKNPKSEIYVSGNVVRIVQPAEIQAKTAGEEETSDVTPFDQITDGYMIVRGYKYYLEDGQNL
jgi:hypothetical protein